MSLKCLRRALISVLLGGHVVAVVAERGRRFDFFAGGVAEVAQGDDVAVPGGEVDRRVDLKGGVRGSRHGVDLDPDRPALPGRRVDHDDGRVPAVLADVVDRDRAGRPDVGDRVDARDLEQDRRALAEAVGGVVGGGVDVDAEDVRRHPFGVEIDPAPGRAAAVGTGVVVVGEGEQAERVAGFGDEVAVRGVRGVDRRQALVPFPCPFPLRLAVAADAIPAIANTRTIAATAALNQVLIGFPPRWPAPGDTPKAGPNRLALWR